MNRRGFTITELLISVAISSVIALTLITITVNYFGDLMRARVTAELAIESQNLLRSMVEDVRLADSLSTTNQNPDPNAPGGGWITNDPSNVMIVDLPALNSDRDILYNQTTGSPYINEVVYFTEGRNMYRRTIIDSAASGNTSQTTCPFDSSTPSCPKDRLYTSFLDDLTFTFFDDTDTTTSDATQARSVQITVSVSRSIYGRTVSFNNTIRTTLRNR